MKSLEPWVHYNHHKSSRMWSSLIEPMGGGPAAVVLNRRWWTWDVLGRHWYGESESNEAAMAAADAALAQSEADYDGILAYQMREQGTGSLEESL